MALNLEFHESCSNSFLMYKFCHCHLFSLHKDSGVKRQYAILKDLFKQYRERERNIYHGMFSSDTNVETSGEYLQDTKETI